MTITVYLHVYDIHENNNILGTVGIGLYHTGIAFNNEEYSFSNNGVIKTEMRLAEFGTFREQIVLGEYEGNLTQLRLEVGQVTELYPSGTYDLIRKNCNHFCDAVCVQLFHCNIPSWINRPANLASSVVGTSHQSSSTMQTTLPSIGVVREPSFPVKTSEVAKNNTVFSSESNNIFNLFGIFNSKPTQPLNNLTPKRNLTGKPSEKKILTEEQKELLSRIKRKEK